MASPERNRIFVLDTNVLVHDPSAIFRFHEHDVFIPMVVLEELDAAKKGVSEQARNVRETSRILDGLIGDANQSTIRAGIPIPAGTMQGKSGRLFFQTEHVAHTLPETLPGLNPDNGILSTAMALQKERSDVSVVVVSKDINLRIKAHVLGIPAEDYYDDVVIDDASLLYRGLAEYPSGYIDSRDNRASRWQEGEKTFFRVNGEEVEHWHPTQCLHPSDGNGPDVIVRDIEDGEAVLELATDYASGARTVWGVSARNREQNFALNLLMDEDLDFVSLLGTAGTGKTLLALAAGLSQTLETKRYREIIMTRVTVPVGEDIGFLPGTEEEKMAPWMGALMDNLEVLTDSDAGGEWGRAATNDLLQSRVKIRSLNFMRGRTFLNRYIILDEAQNLTSKQMMTLITRAGPGTKIVCLGNIAQIDTPYLSETTSGLTYVVDRFKDWHHAGHVTLRRGERSRLADFAAQSL